MRKALEIFKLKLLTSRLLAQIANLLILRWPSKVFWTWEVYGLGYALKDAQGIAQRRKIRTSSDHGLTFRVNPLSDEMNIPADTHVTWSEWRTCLKFPDGRKVIRIQHPWVTYRKKNNILLSKNASGTLVFVPHSGLGWPTEFDVTSYVNLVSSLPDNFRPLVFCLHMHDVNRDVIRAIQDEGFSVVTVGNSLHPRYVRRFYRLLKNFEFATSPEIGSQLFYAHELGLKYFLHDPENKFQRSAVIDANFQIHQDVVEKIHVAFGIDNLLDKSMAKHNLTNDALGLDCDTINFHKYV
jgi:hypothetical protein